MTRRDAVRTRVPSRQDVLPTPRDDHLEQLRRMQRADLSDFDENERSLSSSPMLRTTPAPRPPSVDDISAALQTVRHSLSRASRSPPAVASVAVEPDVEIQRIVDQLQVIRNTPLTVSIREGERSREDDEGADEFDVEERHPSIPLDIPSSARNDTMRMKRRTPVVSIPSTSITPGAPSSDLMTMIEMMRRQHEEMLAKIDRLSREGAEAAAEINRLRNKEKSREEMMDNDKRDASKLIGEAASRTRQVKREEDPPRDVRREDPPRHAKNEGASFLPFPSLSPSSSPSLVVVREGQSQVVRREDPPREIRQSTVPVYERIKMRKHEVDDDEDERKYDDDVKDKKNDTNRADLEKKGIRVGDLPDADDIEELDLSDDEREVRNDERRPDPIIKMPEGDDESHLDNYPKWAERREQMFPFADASNKKIYRERHSLLNHQGRKNEWMRTGIVTQFHPRLFGHTARRWFEAVMATHGVPLVAARERRRVDASAKPPFEMPEMAYDPRDVYRPSASDTEDDLEEDNFTFAALPYALRIAPTSSERAAEHHLDLPELVRRHARQVILQRAGQKPATPDVKGHSSELDDESHPCKRCKRVTVYSMLKQYCAPCEKARESERRIQVENSWIPSMEDDGHEVRQRIIDPTTRPETPSMVKQEPSYSVKMEPYAASTAAKETARKCMTYREQEEELIILGHKTRDRMRNESSSEIDLQEEADSPLGSVLSVVFQPQQRPLLRRMMRTDLANFRDRNAATSAAVLAIGKFDGTTSRAPKYMQDLCTQVQTYQFNEQEIITVMMRTTIDSANVWLQTNLADVFQLPDKPIQALLMRFKTHYVGPHITRDLRKQLATTVLTNPTPTLKDLDTHYATYSSLLTQLKFSDRFVDDKEVLTEYFASLPHSIKTFIGSSFEKIGSINDLHREAQRALVLVSTRSTPKQDGALGNTIGFHAMPADGKPKGKPDERPRSNAPTTTSHNKREAECYHCGNKGHWTGRCELRKGEQTTKGKALWAKRNQARGHEWPYDVNYYIKIADEFDERRKQREKNERSSSSTSRRDRHPNKRQPITVDASRADAELIYDDGDD